MLTVQSYDNFSKSPNFIFKSDKKYQKSDKI